MSREEKVRTHFIDEETTLKDTTAETVYDKVLVWVNAKKMKVVSQNRPFVIKATQGSWLWAGDANEKAKKTFEFVITTYSEGVILRMTIDGFVNAYYNIDETRRKWLEITDGLYTQLGVQGKPGTLDTLYSTDKLLREIKVGYRNMYSGVIVSFLAFFTLILISNLYGDVSGAYSVFATIPLMYGLYGYISARNIRKRLLVLRPVEPLKVPSSTSDKRFVLASILIVVASIATVIYLGANPLKSTYANYGISFQYPMRMALNVEPIGNEPLGEGKGIIKLISRDGNDGFSIAWIKDPTTTDTEAIVRSMVEGGNYTITDMGDKQTVSMVKGCEGLIQYFEAEVSENRFHIAAIALYNASSDKIYLFVFVSEDSLGRIIDDLLASFTIS